MCIGLKQSLTSFFFFFSSFNSPVNGGGGHGPLVPPLAAPVFVIS